MAREVQGSREPNVQRHRCVGKVDKAYGTVTIGSLGGCSEIRMVPDIVTAARANPMVLFHSTDPSHKLHDFMYYSENGTFYAFQATTSSTHCAPSDLIKQLRKQLGTSPLEIYYMVP
jgi:hypothetical protein